MGNPDSVYFPEITHEFVKPIIFSGKIRIQNVLKMPLCEENEKMVISFFEPGEDGQKYSLPGPPHEKRIDKNKIEWESTSKQRRYEWKES